MNSSVYSADRTTHLRIVVVALIASIAILGIAMSLRINSFDTMQTTTNGRLHRAEIADREAILSSPVQADGNGLVQRTPARL